MDQPDTGSLTNPLAVPAANERVAGGAAIGAGTKQSLSLTTAKRSSSSTTAKRSSSTTTAKRSMNLSEAVAIATSSLWAHKLRSVLTLLGVVIGVAAVIAVVSLINGANQYVATKVFNLGADVFGVSKQPSIITNVDDWLEFQKRKRIDSEDYDAIK